MSSDAVTHREAEADRDEEVLAVELEVLREENQRLREEYADARRTQYRRTAVLLAGIGLLAAVAGLLFASARTVLFALSGTGLFLGVLIYYLTPEQFVAADVGTRVYRALARNGDALTAELGLQDEWVYVPTGEAIDDVRLFVPQRAEYDVPDDEALDDTFVVTGAGETRGLALTPTGASLATDFERALSGTLSDDPSAATSALADALVEQFELVGTTTVDVDAGGGRVTVGVTDSAYGPVDGFDHPVASFLASGLAGALDEPVVVDVTTDDGRVEYLVTCRWGVESGADPASDSAESARDA